MIAREFQITAGNLAVYLHSRGLLEGSTGFKARELGGGVSNIVLLAESEGRRLVVKQSLGKLRVKDEWLSDRERIFREAEAIQALRPILGESVPEVFDTDRANHCFVMSAAPDGSFVWKESLLAGRELKTNVAREAGLLLGRMINASRADPAFKNKFRDATVFDQLRVDPYYRTTAGRHPDLRKHFDELVQRSLGAKMALVHGDYSPKNVLVAGERIFLIDFEVVHWGDPAFDAGFLLNHLFLKTLHQPRFSSLYLDAVRDFWSALTGALRGDSGSDLENWTMRHLGGLMLARIDGKSPVEYITEESAKERVRRVARRILLDRPERISELIELVLSEVASK